MQKILLNVSYSDNSGKFWQDSYIKNKVFSIDEKLNIHNVIADIIKQDGIKMTYKNKPMTNIFIDDKDGNKKVIGCIYRGKTEIFNDEKGKNEIALFDVWVEISKVENYKIEII